MKKRHILIGTSIAIVVLIVAVLAIGVFHSGATPTANADEPPKCEFCHGDMDRLSEMTDSPAKLYVDLALFSQEAHAGVACATCHGCDTTSKVPEKICTNGHAYKNPADPSVVSKTCGTCHPDMTARQATSIHANLSGIHTALVELMGPSKGDFTFQATCSDCHASCSSCHMEDPDRRNLLWPRVTSHRFSDAPESKVCVACHVGMGDTYLGVKGPSGHAPSLMAQAGIECVECHKDKDVHGTGVKKTFSMESPKPVCADCHSDPTHRTKVTNGTKVAPQYTRDISAHAIHSDDALSCEACHTVWYQSCWNCHNGRTDKTVEELFLAVSPLTNKIQPAAHSPASSGTSDPNASIKGGWAIKSRHSWGRSLSCETCHTDADVYIDAEERKSPFVGYWTPQHANARFVDEKIVQLLIIDTKKLKQDVHKDATCEDCHQSLTDNVCASCHNKTQKTGKTVLSANADWSRTDYIAARAGLDLTQEEIAKAKSAGMNVAAWQSNLQNLENSYLQISNEFHGNPGQAQTKIKSVSTDSQALGLSIQQAVVAQSSQKQYTPSAIMLAIGLFGAAMLGLVLYKQK
jgi:hypothetical protein